MVAHPLPLRDQPAIGLISRSTSRIMFRPHYMNQEVEHRLVRLVNRVIRYKFIGNATNRVIRLYYRVKYPSAGS